MPESDLELLESAAIAAAVIAKQYWRSEPKTWTKPGDAGPVTEADIEIDDMLRAMLRSARPSFGWLSEESADDLARLKTDTVFVVDPIDGTRAFVAGERTWSHSLAIVKEGIPVAAAVYLPLHDKMYLAQKGSAQLNGQDIQVAKPQDLENSTVLAARPNLEPEHWRGGQVPSMDRHFRTSLAYRLSLVAEGRFDAMLTLRNAWEWDIAAGALIAEAAGATISDRRGKSLRFNSTNAMLDGVVCSNPSLHSELLSRLA